MELGRVVVWWFLYQALLLVGWPIAAAVAPRSRLRGAWMAVPVGLIGLTLPTFWLGQWAYGLPTILVAVGLLVAFSAVTAWRWDFEPDWRTYAEVATVFTVAFVFMVLVRAAAPGIYPGGGEKFLDFGLLQSLLRSTHLPPEDMWFAGTHVLYYYGGHLMAATMAKLTATSGRYAYALALSGFYAMELTAVYGLASSIARDRSLPAVPAGALGAFVWGFASNLLTPARLAANLLPTGLQAWVAAYVSHGQGGMYYIDPNHVAVTPSTFSYWTASRVIPDTINEFPLFSYRNGDLHAHMLSMAITLTLLGVLYAYYSTPTDRRRRRWALLFGVLPPIVGTVLLVNTWSFPTALGLTVLVVAAAPAGPRTLLPVGIAERLAASETRLGRAREEIGRPLLGLLVAALVGAIAVVWVGPFVVNVLLQSPSDRGLGVLPTRSGLGPFVLVHGAFLATFGLYLGARFARTSRRTAAAIALVPLLVIVGWWLGLVGLFLAGPLVLGGWYLLRTDRIGYDGVLLVAGAGLVVLVEFIYVADHAAPTRFNTVFKVYTQVWTVWSVAAGVALASLLPRVPTTLPMKPRTRAVLGQAFVALLVLSLSLYGGMALAHHFGSAKAFSLDGYEYLHTAHPDEAAAIEWLNGRQGQPTIVAAPGHKTYTWENPASSLTGIPTVAGWGHEAIYRGGEPYATRSMDVKIIFGTSDPKSRAVLLRLYHVDYMYVGPRERKRYGTHDYDAEPGISVAFRGGNVTIYRVNRSKLVG